jgi:hypothetical protein
VLVTIQFTISQLCSLLFFISIRKIFKIDNLISNILYIFTLLNPLIIFANNHIMSDTLFMSLSLLWISQLLWIITTPKPYMLICQAFLLLLAFSIRYNAVYYPFLTLLAYLLSPFTMKYKLLGITVTFLFLSAFIQFTRINMEKIGGLRIYSSSAGWKQANNALYMNTLRLQIIQLCPTSLENYI